MSETNHRDDAQTQPDGGAHQGRRSARAIRIGLFIAAAVAVAIAGNVVLLGSAGKPNDPVGRLNPGIEVSTSASTPTAPVTPTTTTTAARPATSITPTRPKPPRTVTSTTSGSGRVTDDHGGGSSGKGSGKGGGGKGSGDTSDD